jgi:hypothetical protein
MSCWRDRRSTGVIGDGCKDVTKGKNMTTKQHFDTYSRGDSHTVKRQCTSNFWQFKLSTSERLDQFVTTILANWLYRRWRFTPPQQKMSVVRKTPSVIFTASFTLPTSIVLLRIPDHRPQDSFHNSTSFWPHKLRLNLSSMVPSQLCSMGCSSYSLFAPKSLLPNLLFRSQATWAFLNRVWKSYPLTTIMDLLDRCMEYRATIIFCIQSRLLGSYSLEECSVKSYRYQPLLMNTKILPDESDRYTTEPELAYRYQNSCWKW